MKIVVDRNIPGLAQTFGHHGELVLADGRNLQQSDLAGATALIVRSISSVDSALLSGSSIGFVGTATIGTDHLDTAWMDEHHVRWASAPGCNAEGTAQYTVAMTLLACERLGIDLSSSSVGIVGCGNVGRRVRDLFRQLQVRELLVCDPYLAADGVPGLSEMSAISKCRIISFHVPLTKTGPHPTHHLINRDSLGRFGDGTLLVNCSRGEVADGTALLEWLESSRGAVALDVWPGEPAINGGLLKACTVATPHVAGYSMDGKLKGTALVYRQFCDWLGAEPVETDLLAGLAVESLPMAAAASVPGAILAACPVHRDDVAMRRLLTVSSCQRAARFDELRRRYPQRRDFTGWRLPASLDGPVARQLRTLGFH